MKYLCPNCQTLQPASHFACKSGAMGGKAGKGKAKARTSEQARAAVNARWAKVRAKKGNP